MKWSSSASDSGIGNTALGSAETKSVETEYTEVRHCMKNATSNTVLFVISSHRVSVHGMLRVKSHLTILKSS